MSEEVMEKDVKRGRPKVTPKVAPKITFESVFGDDRMVMEREHDAESPDYKHMWMSKVDVDKEAPKRGGEVLSGVEHGNDVLVRIPRDIWEKRRDIETERSFQMASKARGQSKDETYSTGNLKQFRRSVREAKE